MILRVSYNSRGDIEVFLDSRVLLHDYFNFDTISEKQDEGWDKAVVRGVASPPFEALVALGMANNYEQFGSSSWKTKNLFR